MNLPAIASARFPENYLRARTAIEQCSQIDECQEWADKAEALASYAKQSKDDSLRKMADRIQARAIRRCGVLLKQIEPKRGANQNISTGTDTNVSTRKNAAEKAGLSKRQKDTALQVASVPVDVFESAVESDTPPTISALAAQGTKKSAKGFARATAAIGTLKRFAAFCHENDPVMVAQGVLPHEISELKSRVKIVDHWLDNFVTNLG